MKKLNEKGFTLVELLAVIVILAILLAIAIPKVTQYIAKSRKDAFIATAKDYTNGIRTDAISEAYEIPIGTDDVTIISIDLIKLERGSKKSAFTGSWIPKTSYVAIINAGTDEDPDYKYYIAMTDTKRYTLPLTEDSVMNIDNIVRNNTAGTKVKVDSMCGSSTGTYKVINNITGLEKYKPANGWNATVYTTAKCD